MRSTLKFKIFFCLAPILGGILPGCANDAPRRENIRSADSGSPRKLQLQFVRVDSEETNAQNGFGRNAVDGNPDTYWHTEWHDRSPGLPHEIIVELIPPSIIKGFAYLPRQDVSDNGNVKDFEFYVSNDRKHFGNAIKKGAFGPDKNEKVETFDPVKCRFIKFKAISEMNGGPWTSLAEIRVIQTDADLCAPNYWGGNIGDAGPRSGLVRTDALDKFIAALSANGGLWINGTDGAPLRADTADEVISQTLRSARFPAGLVTNYQIVDRRETLIGELGIYTIVLVNTNIGQMIVLVQRTQNSESGPAFWWRRIYAASLPINRLY